MASFAGIRTARTLRGRMLATAPPDPGQRRLLLASLADALGTGLFLPISVIYLTRIVGLPATRVGLGLTIAGVVAVLAAPSAGPLPGRFGARTIGHYLSVYKTSMSVQQAIGPALVTAVLVDLGRAGWSVIALILVAGSVASRWLGARHAAHRLPREDQLEASIR